MKEDIILFTIAVTVVAVAFVAANTIGDTGGSGTKLSGWDQQLPTDYIKGDFKPPVLPAEPSSVPLENLPSALSQTPLVVLQESPRAELSRCLDMGEAATRDAACLKAWQNNRQHFLGTNKGKRGSTGAASNSVKLSAPIEPYPLP